MGQGRMPNMPGMFGGGMGDAFGGGGNRPPAAGWRGYSEGMGTKKKKGKDKKKKGFGSL
jgi:signal recognition particle subunit SRP54